MSEQAAETAPKFYHGTQCRLCWKFLTPSVLIALLFGFSTAAAEEQVAEIVSIVGTAEILRADRWHALATGDQLAAGDVVRTGAGSRAAVQLANGTQLKLNAHSLLELKAITPRTQSGLLPTSAYAVQNILRVLSGEIWIRNNGEPLEIRTIPATATIRGTEFNLAVDPGNTTRLTVLEGLVDLSNPQGSVLVTTNEQASARLGEAPRKTVLINPLDAVQWSLYYPGQISFRDYRLTGLTPSRLQKRANALEHSPGGSPRRLSALVELGNVRFDLGQRQEAQAAFEEAARLAPANAAARTGLGWIYLEGGDPESALRALRRVRPTTPMSLVGEALALYQLGRLDEAQQVTTAARKRFPGSSLPHTQAALNALVRGEPETAMRALDRALTLDPHSASAQALRSNIYLVQNRKQLALEAAQEAIRTNPESPTAHLALSAVEQANFKLEAALESARKAIALDPENPHGQIQAARLLFGMGRTRDAYTIAREARRLPPKESMVESTWGFILLARNQVDEAIAAFEEAIALDTTRGEPRLGLGLALFRRDETDAAVTELRKAALLESQVSLYQSYLGKAFYEVKNDPLSKKSLARAKQLDPRDPTPYFYNALRLQSVNRSVEALKDLQQSIARNDNRAVYRSRLLLDEDLAARSASLARIYDDLGFDRLAQLEASKSLNLDRTNFSAHRFLADSYSSRPRHEAARVSELLQAQLLQPLNVAPAPQQLAETNLLILQNAGPARSSLFEYSPLLLRNGVHANVSGIGGNNETLGDEIAVAGVSDHFSYEIGQFHYETNGFRENNDITHDIYRVLGQAAVTPDLNLQAELRWRRTRQGNLRLRFEPQDAFSLATRNDTKERVSRVGAHAVLAPSSDLLVSAAYIDREQEVSSLASIPVSQLTGQVPIVMEPVPPEMRLFPQTNLVDGVGFDFQGQYSFQADKINFTLGAGTYDIRGEERATVSGRPGERCAFPEVQDGESCERTQVVDANASQTDAYLYADIRLADAVVGTLGIGFASFEERLVKLDAVNPKLGLQWNLTDDLRFRAAATKTVKRSLATERTLEPTTVAGFNQFFDDFNGTRAELIGVGMDGRFSDGMHGGIELSHRDLRVPREFRGGASAELRFEDQQEDIVRVYFNLALHSNWALALGYQYEQFEREQVGIVVQSRFGPVTIFAEPTLPRKVETQTIPLSLRYTRPSGLFSSLEAIHVSQKLDLAPTAPGGTPDSDDFVVVNASIGYRLPKRRGALSLEVQNLFDEEFLFQDQNIQTAEPSEPQYIPDRTAFVRISLDF